MPKFPHYQQLDAMDCGPSCLRMISKFYGKYFPIETLREKCFLTREGVSLLGISDAAESIGFRTEGVKLSYDQLKNDMHLPCIAHWRQDHFIVIYKIKKNKIYVADPEAGLLEYTREEFLKHWTGTIEEGESVGICLSLQPTPAFYKNKTIKDERFSTRNFAFLLSYLRPYKPVIFQLLLGVIVGGLLQILFPFLFQAIIDYGVIIPNLSFIYVVLFAMIVLMAGRISVEFIRNWIILHLGTRVNIFLISDFLMKLMRLPLSFFDSKLTGDIIQRINDHKRIEVFLTQTTLNVFYSVITLAILSVVLLLFSVKIFLVFIIGSTLYVLWVVSFMKFRRDLENKKFAQLSRNQSNIIQLISGMQDIKLNNCEKQKRWEWEAIQAQLFRVNIKGLSLFQKQRLGGFFFNEIKDILIIFISAILTYRGNMSLGTLVAVSYVIGQLAGPLEQLIGFMHNTQDAKISLERLAEIHNKDDEEPEEVDYMTELLHTVDLRIDKVSFQYEGPRSPFVLNEISFTIPKNKITAIVGASGSGKTTLIKLLLGFYRPVSGNIYAGDYLLQNISQKYWRNKCGVVLQDGFIFSDTLAKNISISDEKTHKEKLFYAGKTAKIDNILETLPLGYNTKIGQEGHGLSHGQKQRILIARAVYKDPDYIFLDEATNALDANTEREIMTNLNAFFEGRTVVVVAHRLSTVKSADQIIVLDKGKIVESGNHASLTKKRGQYYHLVKNQLELGNS